MSVMVRKALVLALVLAGSGFAAEMSKRDVDRARQHWMSGYIKLESAAKAVQEQKLMFALELYEEALATFQEVQVTYPEWSPDVVAYRIDFTTAKVRELRVAAEVDAEQMSRPDLVRTVIHLRKQRDSFEMVKEKLQADLKAAQEQISTLQSQTADLGAAQAEAAALRQSKEGLLAEKAALEARLGERDQELAALRAAKESELAEAKALHAKELAELRAAKEQELAEAKALREKELAELRAAKEQELAAAKTAADQSAAEAVAKLEEKLAAAQREAAEARELRAALASKTAEAEQAASQATDLRGEVARRDGELAAARAETAELKTRLEALAQAKSQAETASAALLASQAEAKTLAEKLAVLGKTAEELRASEAGKTEQITRLEAARQALDAQLAESTALATARAGELATAKTEAAELAAKVKRLESLVEQAGAVEIDQVVAQARTATEDLKRTREQLAQAQQSLLARTEAEKRLIEERNRQIEAEREAARAKRAREEELHKHLTDAATARQEKKDDDALWHLRKVLEMDPGNVQATSHIGMILADRGDDAEAERMLVQATRLDPENADVLLRLGYVQLRQTKVFDALGSLVQGAKLAPEKAEFRHFAGIACRSLGWPVASEMQLKEAFKLDSKNAETAFNLAVLLATLDEPRIDEAREWYKKALELGAKPDGGLDKFFREH
jgi:Flp pilus assembly protein TadD